MLVVGPAGSGKTSALKRLLLRLAAEARHATSKRRCRCIWNGKAADFLEQTPTHTLHRNGLCDSYDALDEAWVRDALQQGELALLIDDVHHLTGDDEATFHRSGLLDLLKYRSMHGASS